MLLPSVNGGRTMLSEVLVSCSQCTSFIWRGWRLREMTHLVNKLGNTIYGISFMYFNWGVSLGNRGPVWLPPFSYTVRTQTFIFWISYPTTPLTAFTQKRHFPEITAHCSSCHLPFPLSLSIYLCISSPPSPFVFQNSCVWQVSALCLSFLTFNQICKQVAINILQYNRLPWLKIELR